MDTRTKKFLALADRYPSQKAMADALGIAQPHISQIRSGLRALGDVVVQRLERKLHLPEGWFDSETLPPLPLEMEVQFEAPARRPRPPSAVVGGVSSPQRARIETAMQGARETLDFAHERARMAEDDEDAEVLNCALDALKAPADGVFYGYRLQGALGFTHLDCVASGAEYDIGLELMRVDFTLSNVVARVKLRLLTKLMQLQHTRLPRPLRLVILYKMCVQDRIHSFPKSKTDVEVLKANTERQLVELLETLKTLGHIHAFASFEDAAHITL